jgi:hypothetical protein
MAEQLPGLVASTVAIATGNPALALAFATITTAAIYPGQQRKAERLRRAAIENSLRDRSITVRSAEEPHRIVYGLAKVSGPIAFAHSVGASNSELHLLTILAAHPIDAVQQVWFNDQPLPLSPTGGIINGSVLTGRYFGPNGLPFVDVSKTVGASNQILLTPPGPLLSVQKVFVASPTLAPENRFVLFSVSGNLITIIGPAIPVGTQAVVYYTYNPNIDGITYVETTLGSTTQTAMSELVSKTAGKWTTNHRLRGRALMRIRLGFDLDTFADGLPQSSALVRGRLVFDPRTSATAFSDNAALCIRDYLTSAFGLACLSSEIDDGSFIAAANACDEWVTVDTSTMGPDAARWLTKIQEGVTQGTWELVSGTTFRQRRYRCDGSFDLSDEPEDILASMLSSCAGTLTYTGGLWRLVVGVYQTPTLTLTEANITGQISVTTRPSRIGGQVFNAVRGVFISGTNLWQPTEYPPVRNNAYIAEDNGDEIYTDLALPFTRDEIAAQRIAKIYLDRSRQGIIVSARVDLNALNLRPGDSVRLTIARMGWSAKVFRVLEWTLSSDLQIDLVLQEEASASYDWNLGAATLVDPAPDTNLPNPFAVPALGAITCNSSSVHTLTLQDGTKVRRIKVTWPAVTDGFSGTVQISYTGASWGNWVDAPAALASELTTWISGVGEGEYYLVRGRLVNSLGVAGPWTDPPVEHYVNPSGGGQALLLSTRIEEALNWPGTNSGGSLLGSCWEVPDATTWTTAPATWSAFTRWNNSGSTSFSYTTPVLNGDITKALYVIATTTHTGSALVEIRTGQSQFLLGIWVPLIGQQFFARYYQIRVTVSATIAEPVPTLCGLTTQLYGPPLSDAPADGTLYGRQDGEWVPAGGGGGGFFYQSTTPVGAVVGDRWVDPSRGHQYVLIDDGNSTQWVEF